MSVGKGKAKYQFLGVLGIIVFDVAYRCQFKLIKFGELEDVPSGSRTDKSHHSEGFDLTVRMSLEL
jgi:hypothetical protein